MRNMMPVAICGFTRACVRCRTRKYVAHDEENACGVGDRVALAETRPLSATKRWRVAQILEKAK